MAVNGTALASVLAGSIFLYAGIKGKSVSQAVQYVIQGKSPAQAPAAGTITAAYDLSSGAGGTEQQISATGQPVITSNTSGSASQNIALGQMLASTYGWGSGIEWDCLRTGWQEESGWSTTAANVPSDPYNHAYGIPQANPGSKMASAGPNWKTDAATQITWGLIYIKQTYGSPSKVPHWSPNGPTAGYVGY